MAADPIRFIRDCPALLIADSVKGRKRRILVVADVHLGFEHELFKAGIVIAPQADKFQGDFSRLIRTTKADTLVIVGDIKHKVPGTSFRELKEVPKLLESLTEKVKVILVKGNHDDFIEQIVPASVKVFGSRGFRLKGKDCSYGFFHGHAWPGKLLMQCDYLFMGHSHPGIEFKDSFGFRIVEPVWVKGRLDEKLVRKKYKMGPEEKGAKGKKEKLEKLGELQTIIMPTFNPIMGSIALNQKRREYIGPLLYSRTFDVADAVAYMLDGTELGKIRKLM